MATTEEDGEAARRRVILEGVTPQIDGGRFPVKRVVGETVEVGVDAFTDGHDAIVCRLLWRPELQPRWTEVPMAALPNDRWQAEFTVTEPGRWLYAVTAWVDPFKTWRRDLKKRVAAGQDVALDLRVGAALVREASERARLGRRRADARVLSGLAEDLEAPRAGDDPGERLQMALEDELAELMDRHADRRFAATYPEGPPGLGVVVDRVRARFSSWYEMFPRSCGPTGKHGTFRDAEARLKDISEMGFDVLYLPPIHPIGTAFRKGKNNALEAGPDDVGSPWAIGAEEGGHKAIHPELRHPRRLPPFLEEGPRPRPRDRPRPRLSDLARPPLRARAPGVVPHPAGRQHPVRGEPAQEVPGHLPFSLRGGSPGASSGRS